MKLKEIGFTGKKEDTINRHGATTVEGFLSIEPLRYYDFRNPYPLEYDKLKDAIEDKVPVAIVGKCQEVVNEYKKNLKRSLIKIRVKEAQTGKILYINCLGMYHMLSIFRNCIDADVIVGGKIQYEKEHGWFSMINPDIFSANIDAYKRIIPVNSKYKGISEQAYKEALKKGLELVKDTSSYLPEEADVFKLPGLHEAWKEIHFPTDFDKITRAKQKLIYDDMLYFTSKLELQKKEVNISSKFTVTRKSAYEKLIKSLPYSLTESQSNAINEMTKTADEGNRISALIQGDVGSGKTIVAISMMVLMAESGYQAVLMAPTTVLATQHYKDIKAMVEPLGLTVSLLTSDVKGADKKKILDEIKAHKVDIVVGTHSCISKDVTYDNLGFVCTDEEHKFGVVQRQALIEKGEEGVHTITMSGTPIPRTLAEALYGNSTKVYTLTPPASRIPVQTAIIKKDETFFEFIKKELEAGHQAYVVCPLIEDNEDNTISSVEMVYEKYSKYFGKYGFKTSAVTGKTSKEEQAEIMADYKDNKTQILVATTVIEVGINNPNATIMVITGAERFGLSTLHQLRGRVGRGSLKSYCILQPSEGYEATNNLAILEKERDGYQVALADLKNRGTGDIVGEEQSGKNKYIDEMLTYPAMFNKVKGVAKKIVDCGKASQFIKDYEECYGIVG